MSELIILFALTFLVALIYSSVGHGGASGYLAVLSFFAISHEMMASSALCLNVLVAGLSSLIYWKAGHFSWKLTWPFMVTSIPFAFLGGLLTISPSLYALLLAAALSFAGLRLLFHIENRLAHAEKLPLFGRAAGIGIAIGLISGMVGVGGGIFLSPILILFNWADPKKTAATSAFFILVNSIAGLIGRYLRGSVHLTSDWYFMVIAAFFGGWIGSRLGAHHFPSPWLRRVLAIVLFLAVFKLLRSVAF